MPNPASLVGRYGVAPWLRAASLVMAVASWAGFTAGLIDLIFPIYLSVLAGMHLVIGVTFIDPTGVRLGTWRFPFHRDIAWSALKSIVVGAAYETPRYPRLRLRDDTVVVLRHVPASRAPELAELADVPLERGSTSSHPAPPALSTPPKYPTAAEQYQDLIRRTDRLARQNADLRKGLRSLAVTRAGRPGCRQRDRGPPTISESRREPMFLTIRQALKRPRQTGHTQAMAGTGSQPMRAPFPARWTVAGALAFGLVGAIAGLVLGLRAYPPTAWFAVLEVGVPAATAGSAIGTLSGFTWRVGLRSRRQLRP